MKDLLTEKKNGLKFLKAQPHVFPRRVAINSRGNDANKMIISSNLLKKTLFISQIALADKLCFLNRGTHSIMCQASACLSNAFYALSHLFLSASSEPGLPLILSICWAIKARPPSPRMEDLARRLAHERFMSGGKKMCMT